jgi:hypothetical protein
MAFPRSATVRASARLRPADVAMLARAGAFVAGVRVALWVLPYRVVRRWMERPPAVSHGATASNEYGRRVIWAVGAVARRLLPERPCLTQALVAQRLLRRGGIESEMHIGVTRGPSGGLLAHAWLEREGRVLIGGQDGFDRYVPLRAVGAPTSAGHAVASA